MRLWRMNSAPNVRSAPCQQNHSGQVKSAVRHRREEGRELPCRAGGADPLESRLLAEGQPAQAVGEHGRIPRGQVELAGIELGDVSQQGGRGGALLSGQGVQIATQSLIGEIVQRVRLHGNSSTGAGVEGADSALCSTSVFDAQERPQRSRNRAPRVFPAPEQIQTVAAHPAHART
jgi:hypothetical protein